MVHEQPRSLPRMRKGGPFDAALGQCALSNWAGADTYPSYEQGARRRGDGSQLIGAHRASPTTSARTPAPVKR
jgi:hypothetical protein